MILKRSTHDLLRVFVHLKEVGTLIWRRTFSVPFAGPLTHFTTYLTRGTSRLFVLWGSHSLQEPTYQDSAHVEINDAEEYFIGLRVWDDTLGVQVHDSAFVSL